MLIWVVWICLCHTVESKGHDLMRSRCLWELCGLFLLTLLSSMKCTESEDEEPIKGKESQLQLSCFINQEVKYLATGLRLVCDS